MKLKALRAAQRLKASSLGEKNCKLERIAMFKKCNLLLNYEKYDVYFIIICDIIVIYVLRCKNLLLY